MGNIIQWKQGSKMTGSAEPVYKELESIRKKDGNITPRSVVEKAKSKRSALHRHFEWDDSVAAEKFRLEQARKVIRSIEIIHVQAPTVPAKAYSLVTRAPAKVQEPHQPQKVYTSTEEALQDPVMRDELLGEAIRDAIAFRRRYAALQELAQVFRAVDLFIESVK